MVGGQRWRVAVWVADGALALVLAVLGLMTLVGPWAWRGTPHHVDLLGGVLVVAAALPLAVRRRWPLATLLVTSAATTWYLLGGYPYGLIMLCLVVAVYTAAARAPARPAIATTAGVLVAVSLHVLVPAGRGGDAGVAGLVPGSAWVVLPFAVGWMVRLGRQAADRDRTEQAHRLAYEERLRIAQEVHDVVGHGLAAINMQSEVALHVLAKRPEQAEVALAAISRSSRLALEELRAALAVVRRDEPMASRAPRPGLADLDDLVARMSAAGLTLTLRVAGHRREVPAAVDLAAYRVVQEAVTNVLRHAGTPAARVEIGYGPRELTVAVSDSGGRRPDGGVGERGLGIAGMSARVTALGGAFTAGPRQPAGFLVSARFPLPEPVPVDPTPGGSPAPSARQPAPGAVGDATSDLAAQPAEPSR